MSSVAESQPISFSDFEQLREARAIIRHEADALIRLTKRLDLDFCTAAHTLYECTGSVIVSGIGKAGLIGQKIAAHVVFNGNAGSFLTSCRSRLTEISVACTPKMCCWRSPTAVKPRSCVVCCRSSNACESPWCRSRQAGPVRWGPTQRSRLPSDGCRRPDRMVSHRRQVRLPCWLWAMRWHSSSAE